MMQSTGNKQLDGLLGGLKTGDNVVWHDESGSLAPDFFFNFMKTSFEDNAHVVYVSFDRSPKNLITTLGKLAQNPLLTILDCFTHGKGEGSDLFMKFYKSSESEGLFKIIPVKKPKNPDTLANTLETVYNMCGRKVNYIFESLTGIQDLWESEEKVLKFYTRTCPKLYELNTIAYWVLEHKAHSNRLRSGISQIAQVVMELNVKRGNNFLTIKKAEGREQKSLNKAHGYWMNAEKAVFGRKKEQMGGKHDLGSRIKSYRTSRGLPQTVLAKQVGVTPSTISQVESGQIYPSIPALLKISELLSVDMASFFNMEEGECERIFYADSDANEINIPGITGKGISIRELIPKNKTTNLEPFIVEFEPGAGIKSHFFNYKGAELGFLITGKLVLVLDSAEKDVDGGTLINLIYDMATGWKNTSGEVARLFWIKLKK